MEQNSRIKNTAKNIGIACTTQTITLLLMFVSRTFFVDLLGNDYLSCEGLFSNILTVLSFSELGIGSAIIYSLYDPIAHDDKETIGKWMNLFSVAYKRIAIVITIVGLCVVPFLEYIISELPDIEEEISTLYVLYLLNTVASYIWGCKRSFLIAYQKNYIVLLVQQITTIIRVVVQIILLYYTHDYVGYLIIAIICTLISNIISTLIANKKYSWLRNYCHLKLNQKEKQEFFFNVRAILQYKLGSVILSGTDNILISVCLKTSYVGLCSNYNLVLNAVNTIVNQACSGIQATIGNYNILSKRENKYKLFEQLFFVSFWIFGYTTVCLSILLTPFIGDLWLGETYILSADVVLALCSTFYVSLINTIPSMYRTTMGYFNETKSCPIYAAILNIFFSIILSKIIGLSGIFIATGLSRLVTYNLMDAFYVYKKGFNISPLLYYRKLFLYTLCLIGVYIVNLVVISLISPKGICGFIMKLILCTLVTNGLFFVLFFRTKVFKDISQRLKIYMKR